MNEKNKLILKRIIAIVTAFILTFALACLNLCLSCKIITTRGFIERIITNSNYVGNAVNEIKEDLSDLAIPSGLPTDFFDKNVSESLVSELVSSSLEHNLKGNTKSPDFHYIKEDLLKDITAYANENFVTISEETKTAINTLTEECYEVYLRYSSPVLFEFLGQITNLLSKAVLLGIITSILLLGVTLVFLLKLVETKEFFFYSFAAFMGAGLLSGGIPLILLITNKISHIAILSKSLYSFLCSFANAGLVIIVLFSLLFISFSFLMLFLELRKK